MPNTFKAEHLKKQWQERMAKEINDRVVEETEVALTLAGLSQLSSGIDIKDLLAKEDNDEAVGRLAGALTQDKIKQMQSLLSAVSAKITAEPEKATAQETQELDDDMDTLLAGGTPATRTRAAVASAENGAAKEKDEDEPNAKRQKTSSDSTTANDEAA